MEVQSGILLTTHDKTSGLYQRRLRRVFIQSLRGSFSLSQLRACQEAKFDQNFERRSRGASSTCCFTRGKSLQTNSTTFQSSQMKDSICTLYKETTVRQLSSQEFRPDQLSLSSPSPRTLENIPLPSRSVVKRGSRGPSRCHCCGLREAFERFKDIL